MTLPYSPWDLLPAPEPSTQSPPLDQFYEDVVKHLLPDVIKIMNNGIHIDLNKVRDLEAEIDVVLESVRTRLANNPIIAKFTQHQYAQKLRNYEKAQLDKCKTPEDFLEKMKAFSPSDMTHRSYFMLVFSKKLNIAQPKDLLPTGVPKWTVRNCKSISASYPIIQRLLDGALPPNNPYIKEAMYLLATHKANLYNAKYINNVSNSNTLVPIDSFNPDSSKQKQELFSFLGLESEAISKVTKAPTWNRDQIERVNKETADPDIKDFTQAIIDHSFGSIIKNNFIKAFYDYTVKSRLFGSYKLFGAKSFRLTSQNPNLLNAPSTGSIYAKPVKQCFTAPEGKVILAIDYSALEDRVIASLTRDPNKCSIFTKNLDGHCLNALGYFKEEVAEHMELTNDLDTDVTSFFNLQENGNKELKAIRQKGKPVTFGLSYGAYPPKVAATLKIPLPQAEQIFNRYHNELYAGITNYRENYVLPTAAVNGKLHLGLGCYISTDDANRDIRTVNNASCQFWSILTLLTINKMHSFITAAGLDDDIKCISTIYDSIYYEVTEDPLIIEWLNHHLVHVMLQDFMEDQTVHNEAAAEIGYDWASLKLVPNGATVDDIATILQSLKEPNEN